MSNSDNGFLFRFSYFYEITEQKLCNGGIPTVLEISLDLVEKRSNHIILGKLFGKTRFLFGICIFSLLLKYRRF